MKRHSVDSPGSLRGYSVRRFATGLLAGVIVISGLSCPGIAYAQADTVYEIVGEWAADTPSAVGYAQVSGGAAARLGDIQHG